MAMPAADDTLRELAAGETARPVPGEIAALAEAARARHEMGGGVRAVLAYGSTLRGVDTRESLVDLYVLTEDFRAVSANPLSRLGCRIAPPNVYYLEAEFEGQTWRAKYACLPLAQFARWMEPDVSNPYFWARFSQPCRIVWARDEAAREEVLAALARAVKTMIAAGLSVSAPGDNWREIWRKGLIATYGSELRVETADRAAMIVERNAQWCEQTAAAVLGADFVAGEAGRGRGANWRLRQLAGKGWSVLRLAKAAFTFTGGAEYLAWKVERHSGVKVELTDFQRRHPLIASIRLLPELLRKGVIR